MAPPRPALSPVPTPGGRERCGGCEAAAPGGRVGAARAELRGQRGDGRRGLSRPPAAAPAPAAAAAAAAGAARPAPAGPRRGG